MPQFTISTEAAKDIEFFRQYLIQESSVRISDEFLDAVYEKFHLLAKYLGMGKTRNDLLPGLFSFPHIKYRRSIFYKKVSTGIKVIRVLGGKQDHQNILRTV